MRKNASYIGLTLVIAALAMAAVVITGLGCSDDGITRSNYVVSSRFYQGHATDADINNFVSTSPATVGTRLDDCQTCHTGGTVNDGGGDVHANPCDYCHYILNPPEGWTGLPTTYAETLNPYGTRYFQMGRDKAALREIQSDDSDSDGYANSEEIDDLRYPGDANSYPGLSLCPVIKVTIEELKAMPAHTQFGLANTTKQQFDYYATYTGVKIKDILEAKGIDLTGATSIDIMAPDGFAKTFTIEQITQQYPDHRFYSGFGVADLGTDCAFVEYPANTYGLANGAWIGQELGQEQWHIIAYAREGMPLEKCYLDPVTGKINGEGPFRNIIPPGSPSDDLNTPDRGKNQDTAGCSEAEWNFDGDKDHNAGSMVKGTVIIRINPMPEGCQEFDIMNGGYALIDEEAILIYGHNVN